MRRIYLILAVLAGCGPGAGSTTSSFLVDNCAPQPASIEAIQLWHNGRAIVPGGAEPTKGGGQGLEMIDLDVHLQGTFDACVPVDAKVARVHESGGLKVENGSVHVFIGPVDPFDSFDIDVAVQGATAHATISGGSIRTVD